MLDVVMMGHDEDVEGDRRSASAIYAQPRCDRGTTTCAPPSSRAKFARVDGYTAEARAGELLLGVGMPVEQHHGPMSAVAPGWKLRVLLAQALFADPDILLLDEPTNNLDINTIRWLEDVLNERKCTMIIISHDRHFLNSVCTHMADLDYGELARLSGQLRRLHDRVDAGARAHAVEQREGEGADRGAAGVRAPLLGERVEGAPGDLARASRSRRSSSRTSSPRAARTRTSASSRTRRSCIGWRSSMQQALQELRRAQGVQGRRACTSRPASASRSSARTASARRRCCAASMGELAAEHGKVKWAENAERRLHAAGQRGRHSSSRVTVIEWMRRCAASRATTIRRCARRSAGCCSPATTMAKTGRQVLSGGEQRPHDVRQADAGAPERACMLDEPTNHLDMESIESLNIALEKYPGTLIFVAPRPRVRVLARHADHRAHAEGHHRLQRQLRRLSAQPRDSDRPQTRSEPVTAARIGLTGSGGCLRARTCYLGRRSSASR